MYFNIIIQSSIIKRNRYIEKNRINVSEPDTQKTSTEKSSNFKICYNQINFKSRRLFEKNMLHYFMRRLKKNFIRSLFCHTTIDGEFNSKNYILTKICSSYII